MHTRTSKNWRTVPGNFDKLNTFRLYESSNDFGIPDLLEEHSPFPSSMIPFNRRVRSEKGYDGMGIHFFLDDYRFETVWTMPDKAYKRLESASVVLTPDFSLYDEWPIALQVFNIYRARWTGRYWQELGINIIPTITWGDSRSFDFAFLGIPKGMPIAISTVGVTADSKGDYLTGFEEALRQLEPSNVLCYGNPVDPAMHLDNILFYPTFWNSLKVGRRQHGRTWKEILDSKHTKSEEAAYKKIQERAKAIL